MKILETENLPGITVVQQRFIDIDQLVEKFPSSKVRMIQLNTNPLQFDIVLATFDEVRLTFTVSSCPIHVIGEKPKDFITFNFDLSPVSSDIVVHKRKLSPDFIVGFNPKAEMEFILPATMKRATVEIKRDSLQAYLQAIGRSDLDERFWASNYVHTPETLPALRRYIHQILHLLLHQPNFLQQPQVKKLVVQDLIPLLIDSLPPVREDILPPLSPLTRSQLVKQAEDYMMANLDQPLTLNDLCKALHVSRRPLFYGFQEVFGTSPMEYLKARRLQSVRRMLQVAEPETASVARVAQQFGFWSSGHFARDYKTMFGELPSETLNRSIISDR